MDIDGLTAAEVESVQSFGLLFMMFNRNRRPSTTSGSARPSTTAWTRTPSSRPPCSATPKPASSYLPEGHPDYNKATNVYGYDPKKAEDLLKEAGVERPSIHAAHHGHRLGPRRCPADPRVLDPGRQSHARHRAVRRSTRKVGAGDYQVMVAPGDPSVFGNDADLLLRWWYGDNVWPNDRAYWADSPERAQLTELHRRTRSRRPTTTQQETGTRRSTWSPRRFRCTRCFHRQLPTAWDAKKLVGFKPLPTTGLSFLDVGVAAAVTLMPGRVPRPASPDDRSSGTTPTGRTDHVEHVASARPQTPALPLMILGITLLVFFVMSFSRSTRQAPPSARAPRGSQGIPPGQRPERPAAPAVLRSSSGDCCSFDLGDLLRPADAGDR